MNEINEISALSITVGAKHAEMLAATAAENDAAAGLLARVREIVRPALRALSVAPRVGARTYWIGAITDTETDRADWRGVLVAGNGPDQDHPRANSGSYEGCDLYLAADGSWRELTYTGSWSRWQGAGSQWEASERALADLEVAASYDLSAILESVLAALHRQVSIAGAAAARARADRLVAILALI